MVRLLIKEYKATKAQKDNTCNFCKLTIKKDSFYKKHIDKVDFKLVRLHNECFSLLCIEAIKINAENLKI